MLKRCTQGWLQRKRNIYKEVSIVRQCQQFFLRKAKRRLSTKTHDGSMFSTFQQTLNSLVYTTFNLTSNLRNHSNRLLSYFLSLQPLKRVFHNINFCFYRDRNMSTCITGTYLFFSYCFNSNQRRIIYLAKY